MMRVGPPLMGAALLCAIGSCASPPADKTPEPAATAAPAKPEYQKPVRMNGRGKVSSISLEDFYLLHESGKAMVFDARPGFFYGLGHIPGAINIPAKNCDTRIHEREAEIKAALAEGKTLVVYCTNFTCPDARTLATHLSGFGYPASTYAGGWDGWKEAGMPVE